MLTSFDWVLHIITVDELSTDSEFKFPKFGHLNTHPPALIVTVLACLASRILNYYISYVLFPIISHSTVKLSDVKISAYSVDFIDNGLKGSDTRSCTGKFSSQKFSVIFASNEESNSRDSRSYSKRRIVIHLLEDIITFQLICSDTKRLAICCQLGSFRFANSMT